VDLMVGGGWDGTGMPPMTDRSRGLHVEVSDD
jgi:hypothetical protein